MMGTAFRDEIFVTCLLRISSAARSWLSGLAGRIPEDTDDAWADLLHAPGAEESLAAKLGCGGDRVFQVLAGKLREVVIGRALPPLTADCLDKLAGEQGKAALGRILDCEKEMVSQVLLDRAAIMEVLCRSLTPDGSARLVTEANKRPIPAETLFYKLLSSLHGKAGADPDFDWKSFLDESTWIRKEALPNLRRHAMKAGFSASNGAGMVAVALSGAEMGGEREVEEILDSLAILNIRKRIAWVVAQLRETARRKIGANPEGIPESALLMAHLEFYGLESRGKVWSALLDSLALRQASPVQEFPAIAEAIVQALLIGNTDLPGHPLPALEGLQAPAHDEGYPDGDSVFPASRDQILSKIKSEYGPNLRVIE